MNERIRELAKQAGYQEDMFGIGHWDMPECKKFAELIIKETLEVARAGIEYGDGMETAVYTYFEISMTAEDKKTLIKELLGVKNV
jgi:hypothetical protein